jgi:hypothetical protein
MPIALAFFNANLSFCAKLAARRCWEIVLFTDCGKRLDWIGTWAELGTSATLASSEFG